MTLGHIPMLLASVSFVCLASSTKSPKAADAPATACLEGGNTWLTLDWSGNWLPISEHLTVDDQGNVRARLESGTRGSRIGLFGFRLPAARLAELRQAIGNVNLAALDDEYPLEPSATEVEWVILSIDDPELGRKRVKVSNRSRYYPPAMRSLFRLGAHPPTGVLSDLIQEAAQKPIAAVEFSVNVPRLRFRKGQAINPIATITNVGKEPVVLASLKSQRIVRGYVGVGLWHDASHQFGDFAAAKFGWSSESLPGSFEDAARTDLANVVRLRPGEHWRILTPQLVPPSPGEYTITADLHMFRQYDLAVLTRELGEGFISGWVLAERINVTVSQ